MITFLCGDINAHGGAQNREYQASRRRVYYSDGKHQYNEVSMCIDTSETVIDKDRYFSFILTKVMKTPKKNLRYFSREI